MDGDFVVDGTEGFDPGVGEDVVEIESACLFSADTFAKASST